ncbi:MAG: phage coat protein [Clostridiales bacterium]|nr:phage coat protein [Clostridiales bacterium]
MSKFNVTSFNPQAFGAYINTIPQVSKNELIKSRALSVNSEIKRVFASQTGTAYAVLPMYGLLDGEALNYDGGTSITADTTKTYERGVVVIGRAKAWLEQDFAEDITGGAGFMDNVAGQVAEYFDSVDQDTLLAVLGGIFNMTDDEGLSFSEAHTLDISEIDDGLCGVTTLNTAVQKASGDNKGRYSICIMHSAVATNLENINLLEYLKYTDKNGIQRSMNIGTWNGRTVLVDDSMPVEESSGGSIYTTYVLGKGAFDYADVGVNVPYEIYRDPFTNGGQETFIARQRKCFAPYGISYIKANQASLSPTNEELSDGANWEIANDGMENKTYINHRAIPICRIISKG